MMSLKPDLPYLQEWVGKEENARDVLTVALVERFQATLGGPPDNPRVGEIAPLLIHFCLCQPVTPTASLGVDGHPLRGEFLPPVSLPRRMWAGSEIEFLRDIRIGDVVERHSRVANIALKVGTSGELCFVTIDHQIRAGGRLAISERQTLVYRDAGGVDEPVAAKRSSAPDPGADDVVETSAALLFRYSALTFNTHRIHYDLPYTVQEERYPALVVHGPLQATLLAALAVRKGARRPDRFTFRGVAPAFVGTPLHLYATRSTEGVADLWTSQGGGEVAMRARAEWR